MKNRNQKTESTPGIAFEQEFFPEKYIRKSAKLLKLISDESRLRIMLYLAKHGKTYVTRLSESLELNQTTLSHHLSLLRAADLVTTTRDGKNVFYSINQALWRDMGLQFFAYLGKGTDVKILDRFVLRMLR